MEYKLFTVPLEVIYLPFRSNQRFRILGGYSYGFVLGSNVRFDPSFDYGVNMFRLNMEYDILANSTLDLLAGLGYRNYSIHDESYDRLQSLSIYINIGLSK